LGFRFVENVKERINKLPLNPFAFAIRYDNVRCVLVEKFPYMLHYRIDEKESIIEIIALFHTSRNPDLWNDRISEK